MILVYHLIKDGQNRTLELRFQHRRKAKRLVKRKKEKRKESKI